MREGLRAPVLCAGLFLANIAAWIWAASEFSGRPVLLGTALLAYAFGLRHAVDADHIAAIDNATRKLIETGQRAIGTGFFFSLGHATVVVIAVLALALGARGLPAGLSALGPLAGAIGTAVSAASLFALAAANLVILIAAYRLLAALRRGEAQTEPEMARLMTQRGLIGRLLSGLFRLIAKSWHMYPLGFLFGLGFDTATEVGLLAMSAAQAANGLPLSAIIVLPVLFTAGMALVDSLDGLVMARLYRWAAAEPFRKLYYNLAVTALSVFVAVAIGGIEIVGLAAGDASPANGVRAAVAGLNDHFDAIGVGIIALFAVAWVASMLCWCRRSARFG